MTISAIHIAKLYLFLGLIFGLSAIATGYLNKIKQPDTKDGVLIFVWGLFAAIAIISLYGMAKSLH